MTGPITSARTSVAAAAAAAAVLTLLTMGSCTTTEPPPAPPPGPSDAPFSTPTSGDWQTGPPDPGTPTTAPPATAAPTTTPTAAVSATTLAPGKAGAPRGQQTADAQVNRADPNAVAAAFAVRLVQLDARLDNRPNDATRRAAVFATTELQASMTQGAPIAGVGSAFTELQRRDGYTTVTTTAGGLGQAPPDTPTEAYRAITTKATSRNDDGWTGTTDTQTWLMRLTKTTNQWQIAAYRSS